jgi:hypothetical protein
MRHLVNGWMDGWMDGCMYDSIALRPITNHSTANRFHPLASFRLASSCATSSLVFEFGLLLLLLLLAPTYFSFQQPEAIRLFESASASVRVGANKGCNQKKKIGKPRRRRRTEGEVACLRDTQCPRTYGRCDHWTHPSVIDWQ